MPEPAADTTFERDGVSWTVAPGYTPDDVRTLLDRADGPDAEPIKQSMARTVAFVPLADGKRGVLKYYKCRGLRDTAKALWAGSKARYEWIMARRLLGLGIATAPPIAFGERRRTGVAVESWLITEELAGCVTLRSVVEGHCPPAQRRSLVAQLGDMLARLHANRICHSDLHAGNFMVLAGDGEPQLYLLDLHAAHVGGLSQRRMIQNLAMVLASTTFPDTRNAERMRVLLSYCRAGLWPEQDRKTLWRTVDARADRLRARKVISRSKRCLVESSQFTRERADGCTTFRRRYFTPEMITAAIQEHDTVVERDDPRALKLIDGGATKVTLVRIDGVEHSVCVKEYREPSLAARLRRVFVRAPALRSYVAAHGLLTRDIGAPQPLAARLSLCPLSGRSSFFISAGLDGSQGVDLYANAHFAGEGVVDQRRAFAVALGSLFAQIHRAGVWHRDLKATNIRTVETEPNGWSFYIADIDRVRFIESLETDRRARNLAQIHASMPAVMTRTDRLRFLHAYTGSRRLRPADKAFVRDVLREAATKRTFEEMG